MLQIPEFKFWWDKFVNYDMKFNEYGVLYPSVPKHSPENLYVSLSLSIYSMLPSSYYNSILDAEVLFLDFLLVIIIYFLLVLKLHLVLLCNFISDLL